MKKTLSLMLAFLLCAAVLASCGEDAPETQTEPDTTAQTVTETQTETEIQTEEETEPAETEPEFNVVEDPEAVLEIPATFGSHMVLQRDEEIKIWGSSNRDGAVVRGTFRGVTSYAVVIDGAFTLTFPAQPASFEPEELLIEDDKGNSVRFEDVLTGDVWLIGGQSNASVSVSYIRNGIRTTPSINEDDPIRFLMQNGEYYIAHPRITDEPLDNFAEPGVCWKGPVKEAMMEFSALGFYFARQIAEGAEVPVGVICVAVNGAQIQELMSAETAKKCGLKTSLKVRPGGFFNAMVNPLVGIRFKGMVYFQGESEGISNTTARKYDKYVSEYVADMRARFGFEFPFYNVQLSSYSERSRSGFGFVDLVRFAQYDASLVIPNSSIVASYDLRAPDGYSDFMHSPKKEELASRISSLALAREYGIGNEAEHLSPTPAEITLSDDKTTVTVRFDNVGDGLMSESEDSTVRGFFVGKASKLKAAEAEIVSADTVIVKVPEGAATTVIAYAADLVINEENTQLYNGYDLPALAFALDVKQ